jgi:NitT/TauT family transport system substrate-binding protein
MKRRVVAMACVIGGLLPACSGDHPYIGQPSDTAPERTVTVVPPESFEIRPGEAIPEARCVANRAAGHIVYLSGYDFAASASIIDVLVAQQRGYFEDMCLDVEVRPSYPADNYPQIAAGTAQFASAGSFSELVDFAGDNSAGYVALAVEGRTGIDALITKPGAAPYLASLRGTTIGFEGALTPSVRAMLWQAGLIEGEDYDVRDLEGQGAAADLALADVVGISAYKNDQVYELQQAGTTFDVVDPADHGIPGSFGVLYTEREFLTANPSAAQDFVRATLRGLADALADPDAAVAIAMAALAQDGNDLGLTEASERFRWSVDSQIIRDGVTPELPLGLPDRAGLENEVTVYAEAGYFGGVEPIIDGLFEPSVVADIYSPNGRLIWPNG